MSFHYTCLFKFDDGNQRYGTKPVDWFNDEDPRANYLLPIAKDQFAMMLGAEVGQGVPGHPLEALVRCGALVKAWSWGVTTSDPDPSRVVHLVSFEFSDGHQRYGGPFDALSWINDNDPAVGDLVPIEDDQYSVIESIETVEALPDPFKKLKCSGPKYTAWFSRP